jgi:hypothetical protein
LVVVQQRTEVVAEIGDNGGGVDKRRGDVREARGSGTEENNICSHGAFVFA